MGPIRITVTKSPTSDKPPIEKPTIGATQKVDATPLASPEKPKTTVAVVDAPKARPADSGTGTADGPQDSSVANASFVRENATHNDPDRAAQFRDALVAFYCDHRRFCYFLLASTGLVLGILAIYFFVGRMVFQLSSDEATVFTWILLGVGGYCAFEHYWLHDERQATTVAIITVLVLILLRVGMEQWGVSLPELLATIVGIVVLGAIVIGYMLLRFWAVGTRSLLAKRNAFKPGGVGPSDERDAPRRQNMATFVAGHCDVCKRLMRVCSACRICNACADHRACSES